MGIERRRHRLFVTRHTEYHLRSDECVGVRDLESGRWYREHAALRLRALSVPPRGEEENGWIGERLQFFGHDSDVVTSPVVEIKRPEKPSLDHYISLATAGAIAC